MVLWVGSDYRRGDYCGAVGRGMKARGGIGKQNDELLQEDVNRQK